MPGPSKRRHRRAVKRKPQSHAPARKKPYSPILNTVPQGVMRKQRINSPTNVRLRKRRVGLLPSFRTSAMLRRVPWGTWQKKSMKKLKRQS